MRVRLSSSSSMLIALTALCVAGGGPVSVAEQRPEPCLSTRERTKVIRLRRGVDAVPKKVKFAFQNTGNAPLEVSIKGLSCGCAQATLSQLAVSPGHEGTVELDLDAEKISETARNVTSYVVLSTNDPERREFYFQLEIRWIPRIEVTPGTQIAFGRVPFGKDHEIVSGITQNYGKVPLAVDVRPPLQEGISVGLRKATRNGKVEWTCKLTCAKTKAPGPFEGEVVLSTNAPGDSDIAIHFLGIAVGDLDVSPWQVDFGRMSAGSTRRRRILVLPDATGRSAFATAVTDAPNLRLEWDRSAKAPEIWATYHTRSDAQPVNTEIRLISRSGQETVVPVRGLVLPLLERRGTVALD